MTVEHVGPGGVSNSYGVRTTTSKVVYENDNTYQDVFIPTGSIPVTATPSGSGAEPRGIAPSGTVAADGTITLGTALPAVFAQIMLYLPAGAISGGAAGMYSVEMSSTTVGVVRERFGGAARVGSGSAYTGVTTEVTLLSFDAVDMPKGRSVICRFAASHTNSAGTKTSRVKYAGTQVYTVSGTTAVGQAGAVTGDAIGSAQQAWAQAAASGITSLITYTAEDGTAKALTITGQLSAATDAFVLVHASALVTR